MTEALEVVVIEDHLTVRKGLELLLRGEGMRIAGVAAGVAEARQILARRRYDVLLVDVLLQDGNPLALVREELDRDPSRAVVIHTGATDVPILEAAARCGARGFVLKSAAPANLLGAIREVAAGGTYVDPALAGMIRPRAVKGRLSALSAREREILELLADGLNGEEIAETLMISSETVRTHVRNTMTKLGARTRAHAVALVVSERL